MIVEGAGTCAAAMRPAATTRTSVRKGRASRPRSTESRADALFMAHSLRFDGRGQAVRPGEDNRVTTHVSIAAVSLRSPFWVRPRSDATL